MARLYRLATKSLQLAALLITVFVTVNLLTSTSETQPDSSKSDVNSNDAEGLHILPPRGGDEGGGRVLCWVLTSPERHHLRAWPVKQTWASHCDHHVFMSTRADEKLGAVRLQVSEGYELLWGKTKAALQYLYHHHLHHAEWFLKADDDTFVVVENLRYMLQPYDPRLPLYFGKKFKSANVSQGFMGGGAGYVLSREAVRRVVEQGFTNSTLCTAGHRGREDLQLGACLAAVGVMAADSRDHLGRDRFLSFTPETLLSPGGVTAKGHAWFWNLVYYPTREGPGCCSDTAVTFHYVSPAMMRSLHYLLYTLRLASPSDPPPPRPPDDAASVNKQEKMS